MLAKLHRMAGGYSIQSKFATAIRLRLPIRSPPSEAGLATAAAADNSRPHPGAKSFRISSSRSMIGPPPQNSSATPRAVKAALCVSVRVDQVFEKPQPSNTQAIPQSLRPRRTCCATGGTFCTNQSGIHYLGRIASKKAVQPEEFASAQLMPIHQQQNRSAETSSKTVKAGIPIYGNEQHLRNCVRDYRRSTIVLDERMHNSSSSQPGIRSDFRSPQQYQPASGQ